MSMSYDDMKRIVDIIQLGNSMHQIQEPKRGEFVITAMMGGSTEVFKTSAEFDRWQEKYIGVPEFSLCKHDDTLHDIELYNFSTAERMDPRVTYSETQRINENNKPPSSSN